jgi:hypothetical protein
LCLSSFPFLTTFLILPLIALRIRFTFCFFSFVFAFNSLGKLGYHSKRDFPSFQKPLFSLLFSLLSSQLSTDGNSPSLSSFSSSSSWTTEQLSVLLSSLSKLSYNWYDDVNFKKVIFSLIILNYQQQVDRLSFFLKQPLPTSGSTTLRFEQEQVFKKQKEKEKAFMISSYLHELTFSLYLFGSSLNLLWENPTDIPIEIKEVFLLAIEENAMYLTAKDLCHLISA